MLCLIPLCNHITLIFVLPQTFYCLNSVLFIPFRETRVVCAQFDPTLGGQVLFSVYSSQEKSRASSALTHCHWNTAGANFLLLCSCYALTCCSYDFPVSDVFFSFCLLYSISFSSLFSLCLELCPPHLSVSLLAMRSR